MVARLCRVPINFSDSAVFSDSFRDKAWKKQGAKGLGLVGLGGMLRPFPYPVLGNMPTGELRA